LGEYNLSIVAIAPVEKLNPMTVCSIAPPSRHRACCDPR
jgi:hypothetical protein